MQKIVTKLKRIDGLKVISYVRFSSAAQAANSGKSGGTSVERQVQLSKDFCKKYGLVLSDTKYDRGVSGWKKDKSNIDIGEMRAFRIAIEDGVIDATKTLLLIEKFDRLGRQKVTVLQEFFLFLIIRGLRIVTLNNEKYFDQEIVDGDISSLILSIFEMQAAHKHSQDTSERVSKAWFIKSEKLKDREILLTKAVPPWLKVVKIDGKDTIVTIPDRAKIVREIFELYAGGIGFNGICQILNEKKLKTFKTNNNFGNSSISKIIKNPAAFGELRPKSKKITKVDGHDDLVETIEPIKNYYPAVISEKLFDKAQYKLASKKPGGEKVDYANQKIKSLFLGTKLICGKCGGTMGYKSRGGIDTKNDSISCNNKKWGKNDCDNSLRYDKFEDEIIHRMSLLLNHGSFGILPEEDDDDDDDDDGTLELRIERDRLEVKYKALESEMEEAAVISKMALKAAVKLEEQIDAIKIKIEKAVKKPQKKMFLQEIVKFLNLNKTFEGRMKLKSEFSMLFSKIVIDAYGKMREKTIKVSLHFSDGTKRDLVFSYPGKYYRFDPWYPNADNDFIDRMKHNDKLKLQEKDGK